MRFWPSATPTFSVGHSDEWKTSATPAGRSCSYRTTRSEEHTSELQSPCNLVCRLLLEKKKKLGRHSSKLIRLMAYRGIAATRASPALPPRYASGSTNHLAVACVLAPLPQDDRALIRNRCD